MPKPSAPRIRCVAGEDAWPPEDVGGAPGYAEFLEVLKDPAHEGHTNMLTWAGGAFDPTVFDIIRVNQRLASGFPPRGNVPGRVRNAKRLFEGEWRIPRRALSQGLLPMAAF
jgi:hypothetical protein